MAKITGGARPNVDGGDISFASPLSFSSQKNNIKLNDELIELISQKVSLGSSFFSIRFEKLLSADAVLTGIVSMILIVM